MKKDYSNRNGSFKKKDGIPNTEKNRRKYENKNQNELHNDVIIGRNCVKEALRSGRAIEKLLVASGSMNGSAKELAATAKEKGIPVKETDAKKLDFLCGGTAHQGIAAIAAVKEYCSVDDIFECAEKRNEKPFIILLDEIEDPHNLGAIIRTAECTGVHGIIIPKRRSAGLGYTVGKASAGAVEYVNVARVTNICNTIENLKERGVWVFGTDMNGVDSSNIDFDIPVAIVIGNEGKGMGRLVRDKCDGIISLPMRGKINSLNASVAAGVVMYDILRNRSK